jgi:sigma-B regulation protein RsbU (phosphoserine phosphatase)
MGLKTGWIFLSDDADDEPWWGKGYSLAAYVNLPDGMDLNLPEAWKKGCDCQALCTNGNLTKAFNEIKCSRLDGLTEGRAGLRIHASAPVLSGDSVLGVLNVAAPNWEHFSSRSLALLTNMGVQMGVALERAMLFDLVREKRVHEQAALLNLSRKLLGRLDLDDILIYVVREVKELLQADASAVFLLDRSGDMLSFRAASGWREDPIGEDRRIPADDSSASGWVVRNQQPLVYHRDDPDREVPVWTANWLRIEQFQSVAAVPMISEEKTIGTLTLNMRQHRLFDDDELRLLQLMANQAAMAIEQARLHKSELQRLRLEEELAFGRQIQLSLLPKACPIVKGWQFCDAYSAAKQVGGDFYDFFFLPNKNDEMALVIADVSDKGVPAALFMGVSRTIIRSTAMSGLSPSATLTAANKLIIQESLSDFFISTFYSVLNLESGELTFCNAGHNPPLHFKSSLGIFEELKTAGIVLGVFEDVTLEQKSTNVHSDDILVFYTDGVTEAMNRFNEEFGLERLQDIVAANAAFKAEEILKAIVTAVDRFTGQIEQSDDFTLFVIKRM